MVVLQEGVSAVTDRANDPRWQRDLAQAPKDKPIWLWSHGFAGGAIAAYWNEPRGWWSAVRGAGSCLVHGSWETESFPNYWWMLRTEPPSSPFGPGE